jgi:hypothetical protein
MGLRLKNNPIVSKAISKKIAAPEAIASTIEQDPIKATVSANKEGKTLIDSSLCPCGEHVIAVEARDGRGNVATVEEYDRTADEDVARQG